MVSTVACQNCGEQVTSEYARVFGNEENELHACSNCSTQRAVARGAAVDADRDGTLLVYKPGLDDPVRAVVDTEPELTDHADRVRLEDIRGSTATIATEHSSTPDDESFAALVAE